METKPCQKCGSDMLYKKGVSKSGKPYEGWFCQNKANCDGVEWATTTNNFPKKETQKMSDREIQDNISWSVSINNATEIVSALIKAQLQSGSNEDVKKSIQDYAEFYYNLKSK